MVKFRPEREKRRALRFQVLNRSDAVQPPAR
jgi:hypothetical protein